MRQSDEPTLHGPTIDDEADQRYLRGARTTAGAVRKQMRRLEAPGVAPEVVTTGVLSVAIERLVQTRRPRMPPPEQ